MDHNKLNSCTIFSYNPISRSEVRTKLILLELLFNALCVSSLNSFLLTTINSPSISGFEMLNDIKIAKWRILKQQVSDIRNEANKKAKERERITSRGRPVIQQKTKERINDGRGSKRRWEPGNIYLRRTIDIFCFSTKILHNHGVLCLDFEYLLGYGVPL